MGRARYAMQLLHRHKLTHRNVLEPYAARFSLYPDKMNRAKCEEPSEPHPQSDHQPLLLCLVRSRRAQKNLVARTLELVEGFESPQPAAGLASAIGDLEVEALALGLLDVCAVLKSVRQFILTCDAHAQRLAGGLQSPARVPSGISQPMSALLLRVYLTGSDAGGICESEQVQRLLRNHLQHALPTTRYLVTRHN